MWPLDDDELSELRDRLDDAPDSTNYELVGRRSDLTEIFTVPASIYYGETDPELPVPAYFLAEIPDAPDLARLELRETGSATPLGTRTGGETVTIQQPAGGETISGSLDIAWETLDPDGAVLLHTVDYSPDGGLSWRVLAEEIPGTSLSVPVTELPGGLDCRIRVSATDGLLTDMATSAAFSMPNQPPRPRLTALTRAGAKTSGETAVLCAAEALRVGLRADDPEDGPIDGDLLVWSLTGPRSISALGGPVFVDNLAPGDYQLEVVATDSQSLTGSAQMAVTVLPRYLETFESAPDYDGEYDSDLYAADPTPLALVLPGTPASGDFYPSAAMGRHGDHLHVHVSGLPVSPETDRVRLGIDPDASGGDAIAPDDLLFTVRHDGEFSGPVGFRAAVFEKSGLWSVEMEIPVDLLGGWNGQTVGLGLIAEGHGHAASWPIPDGSDEFVPDAWGTTVLRSQPPSIELVETVDETSGQAHLVITLKEALAEDFLADLSVRSGSAEAAVDFEIDDDSLQIEAGDREARVRVTILDDARVENTESFWVDFSNSTGGRLDGVSFEIDIIDNENPFCARPVKLAEALPGGPPVRDDFACQTAILPNGLTVLLGAGWDDTNGNRAGAVAQVKPGNGILLDTLRAGDGDADDLFGAAVAVNSTAQPGDYAGFCLAMNDRWLVAGAPQTPGTGATGSGRVFIYDLENPGPPVTLAPADGIPGGHYGVAVALGGAGSQAIPPDPNDPPGQLLAVGAYNDDQAGLRSGSIYVYQLSGDKPPVLLYKIANPEGDGGDRFGRSLAASGDALVVGSTQSDAATGRGGAVHILDFPSGTIEHQLTAPDAATGARFGRSLAISGDSEVFVGAPFLAPSPQGGAVYGFSLTTGEFRRKITPDTPRSGDLFGYSLAADDDLLVVRRAWSEDDSAGAGSACFFDLNDLRGGGYGAWLADQGLSGADAAPTASPGAFTNVFHYALGLPVSGPTAGQQQLGLWSMVKPEAGDSPSFGFLLPDAVGCDLTYDISWSEDLEEWGTIATRDRHFGWTGTADILVEHREIAGETLRRVLVRPAAPGGRGFARLTVTYHGEP